MIQLVGIVSSIPRPPRPPHTPATTPPAGKASKELLGKPSFHHIYFCRAAAAIMIDTAAAVSWISERVVATSTQVQQYVEVRSTIYVSVSTRILVPLYQVRDKLRNHTGDTLRTQETPTTTREN